MCATKIVINDKLDESQRLFWETSEQTKNKTPFIICSIAPAEPTIVFDTYWRFAAERQNIFFKKFHSPHAPWTKDPILAEYKFTNAYRASDRVSQFLIKHVIYEGDQSPQETFFRILLFKLFNKIETWKLLTKALGTICYSEYSFNKYDNILTRAMENGTRIYSAAYIMPSGSKLFGTTRKHRAHLRLLEHMMEDKLAYRISDTRFLLISMLQILTIVLLPILMKWNL